MLLLRSRASGWRAFLFFSSSAKHSSARGRGGRGALRPASCARVCVCSRASWRRRRQKSRRRCRAPSLRTVQLPRGCHRGVGTGDGVRSAGRGLVAALLRGRPLVHACGVRADGLGQDVHAAGTAGVAHGGFGGAGGRCDACGVGRVPARDDGAALGARAAGRHLSLQRGGGVHGARLRPVGGAQTTPAELGALARHHGRRRIGIKGPVLSGFATIMGGVHPSGCSCRVCFAAQTKAKEARAKAKVSQPSGKPRAPRQAAGTGAAGSEEHFGTTGEATWAIRTPADVARMARLVEQERVAHGHALNARSSRSHCLVRVTCTKIDQQGWPLTQATFCLLISPARSA